MRHFRTGFVLLAVAACAASQTFAKHSKWFMVGPNPCAIVGHDLTGDGIPEIVTADRGAMGDPSEERPANDEMSFLVAQGPLEYVAQPPLRAGFAPWCIAVANMDALKAPDLVVASFHESGRRHVTVFLNIGDNLFRKQHAAVPEGSAVYRRHRDVDQRPVFTVPGLTSLVVRDLDGDGYRDVVATGWSSDVLAVFPGAEDTCLGTPRLIAAPGGPRDVAVADLDGDGHVDLVTTMYVSGEIVLWRGDGEGGFTEEDRFRSREGLPHKVRVADVNGDGATDLVVSHCHTADSVVVHYGEDGFSFPVTQELLLGADRRLVEHEIRDILVEDLDSDGKLDIAAACSASNQVAIFMNRSDHRAPAQEFDVERYSYSRQGAQPRALCSADFNGDGEPDVGVALREANAVALLLSR